MAQTDERNESLWWLSVSPIIWMVHLLAVYITVAVFCAKAVGEHASLASSRWLIAVYTAVALAGAIATGVRGLRRHQLGAATVPHDFDTPEDRHRFLGFAIVLLSGLSAVGILFVALPALFIQTCR